MDYSFQKFMKSALVRLLEFDKYNNLIQMIKDDKLDLSESEKFQKCFNSFYRIRRNKAWREKYYKYFQKNRYNENLTFEEILDYMYDVTNGNIEASFCSKMLSTINPNMPIWDQYVLDNLNLKVCGNTKEERLKNAKDIYKKIINEFNDKLNDEEIKKSIQNFRAYFTEYNFSDVKILDFILWNNRDNKKGNHNG